MKKLFLISTILLLVSCGESITDWPVTPNQFVIIEVQLREGQVKHLTTYRAQMQDNTDLGSVEFWFSDSTGKYNVGDIVEFNKTN